MPTKNEENVWKKIRSNAFWLLADRVLRTATGLIIGTAVARYLGPEQYGILAYALSAVALLQTLTLLGLDAIVVRTIATRPRLVAVIIGTAWRIRLMVGMALFVLGAIYTAISSNDQVFATSLFCLCAFTLCVQAVDTFELWFQSNSQSRIVVLSKIVGYLCASAVKIALIVNEAPLMYFAATQTLDVSISAFLVWRTFRRHRPDCRLTYRKTAAYILIRQSWPFLISGVSVVVYTRLDQFLLAKLAGPSELGLLAAILPFSQGWYFIPTIIAASILPALSRSKVGDESAFRSQRGVLFAAMFYSSLFVVVLTWLAAPIVVETLLGGAYLQSTEVLRTHIWTNLFVGLGVAHTQCLVVEGRHRLVAIKTMVGAVASLALNSLLIPRYGAMGCAIAAVGTQAIAAVAINTIIDRAGLQQQLSSPWSFKPKDMPKEQK